MYGKGRVHGWAAPERRGRIVGPRERDNGPRSAIGRGIMGRELTRAGFAMGAALLLSGAPAAIGAQAQQQALVIQGGTLIDGNGGAPVPNSVVVIQGNQITAAGPAAQVQVPAGARVINAN